MKNGYGREIAAARNGREKAVAVKKGNGREKRLFVVLSRMTP